MKTYLLLALLSVSQIAFSQAAPEETTKNFGNRMETLNASGGEAMGSEGIVTYSIGQVFYTYLGTDVYHVAQGVQHADEVGKGDSESEVEVSIYPNPTSDQATIALNNYENQEGTYQLFDINGRLLLEKKLFRSRTKLNLNNLIASIYILKIKMEGSMTQAFKIIKN